MPDHALLLCNRQRRQVMVETPRSHSPGPSANKGKTERVLEQQAREVEQERGAKEREFASGKKRYTEGK